MEAQHGVTQAITAFRLEQHSGPYDSWPGASRLFRDGCDTGRRLGGYTIDAQFSLPGGFLIVTSYDCPYEEVTEFYLLDRAFRVRGHVTQGNGWFNTWPLESIVPERESAFLVEFSGGRHWRLVVRQPVFWRMRLGLRLKRRAT